MKDKYVIIKQLGQLTLVLFVYAIARYLNFKTKYDPDYIYDERCFMNEMINLNQQVKSVLNTKNNERVQVVRINNTCNINQLNITIQILSDIQTYNNTSHQTQQQVDEENKLCGNIKRFVNDSQLFDKEDNPNAQTFYEDSYYWQIVRSIANNSGVSRFIDGIYVNTELQISKMILNRHTYRYQWNPNYYFQKIENNQNTTNLLYLYEHMLNTLINLNCGPDNQLCENILHLKNIYINSCLFKKQNQREPSNTSDLDVLNHLMNVVNCGLSRCERYFGHQYIYYDGLLNSMIANEQYNMSQSDSMLRLFDSLVDSVSLFQSQYEKRLEYERVYIVAIFSCIAVFLLFLLVAARSYDNIDKKMKKGFSVLNEGNMRGFTRGLGKDLK